ncbi:ABC transporter substrate-binding protein [Desulforamulus aeronauticus]|uniref:NitT/TauT family transport system substrate-binding protein n=1 Tax=Desulforamulus aeronauticus DSM 10349 TaxID=1121421 RepID=A0A1M6TW09_9FIRM|nr:ABC transporter substrate-binding protein [Desulforamulus aeronauticus]SHK61225.1 NitT/TauT family transport system substrate-binding protein [Desulforamulus aeronauticus DSM 10349]
MRKRWKWLPLILLLTAAAGLVTYGVNTYLLWSVDKNKSDRIRVVEATPSLLALPHYIALAQGFYREQELEVISSTLPETKEENFKLTAQGDVLLGDLNRFLFTSPLGTGAKLVCFASLARRDGTFLLSRPEAEVFSWDKMKRKSILGDAPDSQSNIILEEALRKNKLTLQHQVIIIQNLPEKLKQGAFQAGVGHYVQMSEPLATLTEQQGAGKIAIPLGSVVEPIPSLVFLAPAEYLKEHSHKYQKLVNGLCKAMLWLDYHTSAEAARVTAPYFPDLAEQTLVNTIERYKKMGLWDKTPVIHEQDYQNLQNYVRRAGELTNPVAYQDGVQNKYAKKAVQTVKYIPPDQQPKKKNLWERVKSLDFK